MTTAPAGAGQVLSALADPTRRQVLQALASRGEATATELTTAFPVSRQAIVKHLAVLEAAGLVTRNRAGREVRYSPCPGPLTATATWMASLAATWKRRLQAIKQAAEALRDQPPANPPR